MEDNEDTKAVEALNSVIMLLTPLSEASRTRVLKSVLTFFPSSNISQISNSSEIFQSTVSQSSAPKSSRPQFSEDHVPSPKEFLAQKQPKTDVERIACLAYYLTHYRDTPYFKTLDLAKLNTEGAQPKFSNSAYAANNAQNSGYLVPASKGQRQISAAGEQFVLALPDRDAARQAISNARRRKNVRRKR